jgi:DNA-binding response OmpR family regulator
MIPEKIKSKKILIVDDDTEILTSLKMLFEMKDYQVFTAENGRQCLNILDQGYQGIIILDIMMPLMDGIKTIKSMVLDGFIDSSKIIILTAKKIQGEEFNDIYQHIHKYIKKPFDVNELLDAVEELEQKT